MNFLTDSVFPAINKKSVGYRDYIRKVSLQNIFCGEEEYDICYPTPYTDFGVRVMLSALGQILFPPKNPDEKKRRIKGEPISQKKWDEAIDKYKKYFDITGDKNTFLQYLVPDIKATAQTIHKLASHSFEGPLWHHSPEQYQRLCPTCAMVSLFTIQQMGPSIQGNHPRICRRVQAKTNKFSTVMPVMFLVYSPDIKKMIAANSLDTDTVSGLWAGDENEPAWMEGQHWHNVPQRVEKFGLFRALFWPSIPIKFVWEEVEDSCDCCGIRSTFFATSALWQVTSKEKAKHDLEGVFRHPYTIHYERDNGDNGVASFSQYNNLFCGPIEGLGSWLYTPASGGENKNKISYKLPYTIQEDSEDFREVIVGGLIQRNQPTAVDRAFFERYPLASQQNREKFFVILEAWKTARNLLLKSLKKIEYAASSNSIVTSEVIKFDDMTKQWLDDSIRDIGDEDCSIDTSTVDKTCLDIFDKALRDNFLKIRESKDIRKIISERDSIVKKLNLPSGSFGKGQWYSRFLSLWRVWQELAKGEAAEIKRVSTVEQLKNCPAVDVIFSRFPHEHYERESLLRCILLMPYIDHQAKISLGKALSGSVSEQRIKNLFSIRDCPITQIRDLLRIVSGRQALVDVGILFGDVYFWSDEKLMSLVRDFFRKEK